LGFGDRLSEIVGLIKMKNIEGFEFRLDLLEAPEQHPNAL
jgi:hypothetical protein